ncbi:hypothetical protein BG011_010089 [Mortierella polycephala]|uniref:Protein kinase domain-containing protein n=1 Tax=Mortierella polycephala TaxID=41804 RepID=A0A9P6TV72_9FUNG|nr:hypothetical protein BG011_010089 [Mortierella polycephala]
MADTQTIVSNFMESISDAARQVKVNRKTISFLIMECEAVIKRLESGELGSKEDPRLDELVEVFGECRSDLIKFTGIGFLLRGLKNGKIPGTCEHNSMKLQKWLSTPLLRISDEEADEEDLEASLYKERVLRIRAQAPEVSVLDITKLKEIEKIGKFPFGTIYSGTYDGNSVYIRKIDGHIKDAHIKLVWDSIRRSRRFFDSQNILFIHGICEGRMIVTETTTCGPLDEFSNTTPLQKVSIAREIANTILAMHDTAADGESMKHGTMRELDADKERVLHGDLRAANILIDKSKCGDGKLTAKITGFEMCKQSTTRTGEYPHIDESYRRWWSPERKNGGGATVESEVYSFGVLMYEISTGNKPEDGDLVLIEHTRMLPKYTTLMGRCLDTRIGSRPSMEEVVQELVSIEGFIIAGERELR